MASKSIDTSLPKRPGGPVVVSIRALIVFLLLLVGVPCLLFQVGIYYYWLRTAEANQVKASVELSRLLASAFDGYILDLGQHEASLAAAIEAGAPMSEAEMTSLLHANAQDYPALNAFLFIDPQGRVEASSDPRIRGLSVQEREYFQRALASKGFVISDMLEGRIDPNPIFVVARAVYKNGRLEGVISGAVAPKRLGEATLKLTMGGRGALSIFDRQGHLVYREPSDHLTWDQQENADSTDLLKLALSGSEAQGMFHVQGREDRIGACVPIGKLGWVAGADEPRSAVTGPMMRTLAIVAGMNVLVIGLSLIMAGLISRGMIRGIRELRDHAVGVENERLEPTREVSRVAELRDLGSDFNEMLTHVAAGKQAQAELRENHASLQASHAFLQAIIDAVPETTLVIDRDYRVVLANRAARQMAGGKDPVSACLKCHELSHHRQSPCNSKQDPCPLNEVVRTKAPVTVTHTHYDADNNEVFVEITASPILDDNGEIIQIVEACHDVSERKRSEEALRQSAAELARSNQDLAQFANVASHDLQEPLRMVGGFLKIISEKYAPQLDDQAREYIGFAVDGANRMSQLISDLLTYARAGREGKGFVETDMESVLAHVVLNLQASIEDAKAVITHDPLPTVKVETALISQLFQNLISNAIKYRAEGTTPQIHVGANREDRGWRFCVRDNGIGIKAEECDRVFMIFQRLHTRQEYPGTGIGLAICKRIVEYHCGRIWIESEPGKGSTFYFTIPDRD